jgi:hypothetical protein
MLSCILDLSARGRLGSKQAVRRVHKCVTRWMSPWSYCSNLIAFEILRRSSKRRISILNLNLRNVSKMSTSWNFDSGYEERGISNLVKLTE